MNYLKLIRYKNLLIIIATMFIIRYALIKEFMPFQLSFFGFCLLVLATVCISAAGYIINDYFDVNADMMNKPDSVIIGKCINRRNAMILHWVLNIIGCVSGAVVSYGIGRESYSLMFIFIVQKIGVSGCTMGRNLQMRGEKAGGGVKLPGHSCPGNGRSAKVLLLHLHLIR